MGSNVTDAEPDIHSGPAIRHDEEAINAASKAIQLPQTCGAYNAEAKVLAAELLRGTVRAVGSPAARGIAVPPAASPDSVRSRSSVDGTV